METLNDYIKEYKNQLEAGDIQKAYRGLITYMTGLKSHFTNKYPDNFFAGHFYQGYMDITYFTFTPISLKSKKLKIGIGFNHEKMQFGVWLSGQNRQIQKEYWEIFKVRNWNKYHVPSAISEGFSITECVLVENPDFNNPNALTAQIETKVMNFITDITNDLVN